MTVIVPTDWTSVMTAIGTVAVAVVAVAVALFAEWRTGIRIADERDQAAKVLVAQQAAHDKEIADERALADEQLTRQLEHSAAQLAEERKAADARLRTQIEHSDAQLREERQNAQEAEQLTEAWSVQIVSGRLSADASEGRTENPEQSESPVAIVVNKGRYTINRIEGSLLTALRSIRLTRGSTLLYTVNCRPRWLRIYWVRWKAALAFCPRGRQRCASLAGS